MTVARNEPVTLSCKANGTPRPTIEWYRNGQLVKMAPEDPVSHRILLPDGSLFFLKAMQSKKEQDGGTYWCVASNEIGVARSNNATLEIACKFKNTPKFSFLSNAVGKLQKKLGEHEKGIVINSRSESYAFLSMSAKWALGKRRAFYIPFLL